MPTRTVRARVHAGHFEPLEELALAEGAEVTLTFDMPGTAGDSAVAPRAKLGSYPLGAPFPLTRAEIYDDVG